MAICIVCTRTCTGACACAPVLAAHARCRDTVLTEAGFEWYCMMQRARARSDGERPPARDDLGVELLESVDDHLLILFEAAHLALELPDLLRETPHALD